MILTKNKPRLTNNQLRQLCKTHKIEAADELIDFLVGEYQNDYESDYQVMDRWSEYEERTFMQRINWIWVLPVYFMCVPFAYIFIGKWEIQRNSKLGDLINRLIKIY